MGMKTDNADGEPVVADWSSLHIGQSDSGQSGQTNATLPTLARLGGIRYRPPSPTISPFALVLLHPTRD